MLTPPLDPDAIRYLRMKLRMTLAELAYLIRMPEEQLCAAEEGLIELPPWVVHRLRRTVELAETIHQIQDAAMPPPPPPEEDTFLGQTVRRYRQSLGMTLAQVSEGSGIHPKYLNDIEIGRRPNPTPATMQKIARAMHIPLAKLDVG